MWSGVVINPVYVVYQSLSLISGTSHTECTRERETVEEIYDDGAIDFESNKPFCVVYMECGGGTVERKDIYDAIDIGLHNHKILLSFSLPFSVF